MQDSTKALREAIKAFNEAKEAWDGIREKKVNPIGKFDDVRERFLEAVEMIPESREHLLPDVVVEAYNYFVEGNRASVDSEDLDNKDALNEPTKKEEIEVKEQKPKNTRLRSAVLAIEQLGESFTTAQWTEKTQELYDGRPDKKATEQNMRRVYQVLNQLNFMTKKDGVFYMSLP